MQEAFQGFPVGGLDTSANEAVYVSQPLDGTTSVSTTTLAGFATPWQIIVPVRGGESVRLDLFANFKANSDSLIFMGITRNGLASANVIARGTFYDAGNGTRTNTGIISWVDVLPGTGRVVYEVVFGVSSGGTITINNHAADNLIQGSPFTQNAPSMLQARIVTVVPAN